jgi:hypothetical protein
MRCVRQLSLTFSMAALLASGVAARASLIPPGTGLQFWVKSDTGVATVSGNVTTWADQSGQGHNATGVTGALPTTSSQTVGDHVGQPVVAVTGGQSMRFTLPSANLYSGMTVLFVASAGASRDAYETVVSSGSTSLAERTPGIRWAFELGSATSQGLGWAGPISDVDLGSGAILTSNTFYMNGYRTDKTAWDVYVSKDDTATKFSDDLDTAAAPADTSFPTGVYNGVLGAESPGLSTYALSGYIAEVLIYDHSLSPTEMNNAVAYLNDRYFYTPEPTSFGLALLASLVLIHRRRS